MNITGKFYLFANKKKGKDGETITYVSTNIAETDKDGDVVSRLYMDVRFRGDDAPSKKEINKMKENVMYELDVSKAFLSCRSYENSDGEKVVTPVLIVLESEITDSKPTDKPTKGKKSKKDKKASKAKAKDEDEDEDEEDEEEDEEEEVLPF